MTPWLPAIVAPAPAAAAAPPTAARYERDCRPLRQRQAQRDTPRAINWTTIYDVKFAESNLLRTAVPGAAIVWNGNTDYLVGRGEARRTPRRPGCQ